MGSEPQAATAPGDDPTAPGDAPAGPLIAVAPDKYAKGIVRLDDVEAEFLEVLPLREALERAWRTDAHVVQYLADTPGAVPRCRKAVLPAVREAGGDLLAHTAFFDWDVPQHGVLTPERWAGFVAALYAAADAGFDMAARWVACYTTLHGARVVYALDPPMPVDVFEAHHRAAVREFARRGVHFDPICSDWTRVFRAPRTLRDGTRTEDALGPLFELVWQPGATIDLSLTVSPDDSDRLRARTTSRGGEPEDVGPMPDAVKARALLWRESDTTGKTIMSDWHRAAKSRLKKHECAGALWGVEEIAPQGHRHATLLRWAGSMVRTLFHMPGSSPEAVWALFLDACARVDPKTCKTPPEATAWQVVAWCWAQEAARNERRLTVQRDEAARAEALIDRVASGMREWCAAADVHGDDEEAKDWLSRRLIAATRDKRYYVMRPDGYYDSVGVPLNLLTARIRELDMGTLLPSWVATDDGGLRAVKPQDLVDAHGIVVGGVEGVVGTKGSIITRIEDPDRATLTVRLFGRRTDLSPLFDEYADDWLAGWTGGRHSPAYLRLNAWIGLSLAFDEGPICALSLQGPPSTGKGLFVQGLAECVDTECYSDAHEFGDFQAGLVRSPFLFVNEGVPESVRGDIADQFRAWVDGSPIILNQKFLAPFQVRNPLRVVFAANNEDVVSILAGRRDLTLDDQAALALRLWHLKIGHEGANYLRSRGGFNYTGREGRRWVRGPAGQPSDYVLARHFLALYEMRPKMADGARFLMEGPPDNDIIARLGTRIGNAPEIVETLVSMVESKGRVEGLEVLGSELWVTISGVLDHHRAAIAPRTRQSVSWSNASRVLHSLQQPGTEVAVRTLQTSRGESRRARWVRMDVGLLVREAEEHGYACQRLKSIARAGESPDAIAEDVRKLTEGGL